MRLPLCTCVWIGLMIVCGPDLMRSGLHAQTVRPEPMVPEKVGKELHAFRITGAAPRIDGQLDDESWRLATSIDDLVQNEPDVMQPPTERTVVQVAYDDRYIYIAARCFMRDTSQITTGLGRRDNLPPSDVIRFTFDPRHDHLTAYTFDTNPSGVQSDYTWFDDTPPEQRLRRGLERAHADHGRGLELRVSDPLLADALQRAG